MTVILTQCPRCLSPYWDKYNEDYICPDCDYELTVAYIEDSTVDNNILEEILELEELPF